MEYCLKYKQDDCHICFSNNIKLISPHGYEEIKCLHYLCEECWENIGKVKPLCPMCRENVSIWMTGFMKFKICTNIISFFDTFYFEDIS